MLERPKDRVGACAYPTIRHQPCFSLSICGGQSPRRQVRIGVCQRIDVDTALLRPPHPTHAKFAVRVVKECLAHTFSLPAGWSVLWSMKPLVTTWGHGLTSITPPYNTGYEDLDEAVSYVRSNASNFTQKEATIALNNISTVCESLVDEAATPEPESTQDEEIAEAISPLDEAFKQCDSPRGARVTDEGETLIIRTTGDDTDVRASFADVTCILRERNHLCDPRQVARPPRLGECAYSGKS